MSREHSGAGPARTALTGAGSCPGPREQLRSRRTWWAMSGRTSAGSRPLRSSSALCLSQLSSSNVLPTCGRAQTGGQRLPRPPPAQTEPPTDRPHLHRLQARPFQHHQQPLLPAGPLQQRRSLLLLPLLPASLPGLGRRHFVPAAPRGTERQRRPRAAPRPKWRWSAPLSAPGGLTSAARGAGPGAAAPPRFPGGALWPRQLPVSFPAGSAARPWRRT